MDTVTPMAKVQLTERQKDVYELIQSLIIDRGYGPTVREIGEHFGIKSPNGVMCHLRALERKGLITRKANKSRAIELVGQNARSVTGMPLSGVIGTLPTSLNMQSTEAIDLGKLLADGSRFVVEISGDSLIDRGIHDGDHVVIRRDTSPRVGQLALVQIAPERMLLRYWHPTDDSVHLKAANSNVPDVVVDQAAVIGIAAAVVRTTVS